MRIFLDLQKEANFSPIPSKSTLKRWMTVLFNEVNYQKEVELTIRFVEKEEIKQLNNDFRKKNYATNILSFPFSYQLDLNTLETSTFIGDLVICPEIVKEEAITQRKKLYHHLCHIVIHGCLHLLGFDHEEDIEAEEMERLECLILNKLNIKDPYLLNDE